MTCNSVISPSSLIMISSSCRTYSRGLREDKSQYLPHLIRNDELREHNFFYLTLLREYRHDRGDNSQYLPHLLESDVLRENNFFFFDAYFLILLRLGLLFITYSICF